jgi:predicted AlkP superfamily phosphohydrolase/phosphomutase
MVSCFLTPGTDMVYTHPADLKQEVERVTDGYILDVEGFRSDNKDNTLSQIYQMTEKRFMLARHLMKKQPWDFFMFHEIAVDRLQHGFWKYFDPAHPKHEPGHKYENAIFDYYKFLDGQIGSVLDLVDENTIVYVLSDHGAKAMKGGLCINEWLIKNGYLAVKSAPTAQTPLKPDMVDWSRTVAWGAGGYYGRVFLNVRGREPNGVVAPEDYENVRDELKRKIEAIPDHEGNPLKTVAYRPEDVYKEQRNIAPDLIVYFDDLAWRSVGSIGHGTLHIFENDTGPDDANHADKGIFVRWDSDHINGSTKLDGLGIMDIAPTILNDFGIEAGAGMRGRVLA